MLINILLKKEKIIILKIMKMLPLIVVILIKFQKKNLIMKKK